MPALRKSARKSRTSTPYATPTDLDSPTSDTRREKQQGNLDGWIEPPPKKPVPSFEDHGFARHGVLETMAPLGVPPNAKMRQQARALTEPATRRGPSGRAGADSGVEDVVSTPEATPAPELERHDDGKDEEEEFAMEAKALEDDEDDDEEWRPAKSKAKAQVAKTPVRGKTPVQNKTPKQKTPIQNGISRTPVTGNSIKSQGLPPVIGDVAETATWQRLMIVINDAMARALANNRAFVGEALRKLNEESEDDKSLRDVLVAIISQSATPEQYETFRTYIKQAKRRIKREAKARGEIKPHISRRPSKPHSARTSSPASSIPAKDTRTVSPTKSTGAAATRDDAADSTALPSGPMEIDGNELSSALQNVPTSPGSEGVPSHPLATAPSLAKHSPSPNSTRMSSKSPSKTKKINGVAAAEQNADAGIATNAPSPAAETPESAVVAVSDSDLSDVNEEIVQNGPPEPLRTNGNTPAPAVPKKAPAIARVGKKSRASSAKPNGRYEKKQPLTAEELAEEAEILRRKEQMAEQQPVRLFINPPVSDTRFEDEMLETESLTESQIAVGPPMDSGKGRRAGKASHPTLSLATGKRLREDTVGMSSPRPGSAASTRPSTPALGPPQKKLRLNNGNARIKRSPVKNRNGPIAGMSHSGGGSRQFGPDDNDPDSPQTESDDFCFACKGPGEFVCCDNCTRVFHFLCCDPPRLDPPEGSFLCHDCDAKLTRAEHRAVDAFTPKYFVPLFKQLESTNTRAFSLPSDIQNYFEGVSAKDDGSYAEEVKKIPLSKNPYGYQRPDYTRTHDANGKMILCVQCGQSSAGRRPLIQCDFCDAFWHLDCCDPPLANPPPINLESTTRDAWKCPRHVDHDLRNGVLVQRSLRAFDDEDLDLTDAVPRVQVTRKVRKPKHAPVVDPTFSRGMRNDGLIEIINDSGDETDGQGNYVFNNAEDAKSKVYRIPEKGIILDFLDKVKRQRIEQKRAERKAAKAATRLAAQRKASQQLFAVRPIEQQQAALHLAQLARKESDIGLNETNVDALCLTLTAEAPADVVTAMSNGGPGPLTDEKRAELLKLRELIDRALKD